MVQVPPSRTNHGDRLVPQRLSTDKLLGKFGGRGRQIIASRLPVPANTTNHCTRHQQAKVSYPVLDELETSVAAIQQRKFHSTGQRIADFGGDSQMHL